MIKKGNSHKKYTSCKLCKIHQWWWNIVLITQKYSWTAYCFKIVNVRERKIII